MPHIIDQCQMGLNISSKYGTSKKVVHKVSTPQAEDRPYASISFPSTPASSTLARFIQSPQQTNLNFLPTPVSSVSAVFDLPGKPSPSSSLSSTNSTVAAELEDTSPGNRLLEMEDTSEVATKTSSMSALEASVGVARSQALVVAIDRQLSTLELENSQLRRSLRDVERELTSANQTSENASRAFDEVRYRLADREYELEHKNRIIAELEKEVEQCRSHHPPPLPPSKPGTVDPLISRFHVDASRTTLTQTPPSARIVSSGRSVLVTVRGKPVGKNTSRISPSGAGESYSLPSNSTVLSPNVSRTIQSTRDNPASVKTTGTVNETAQAHGILIDVSEPVGPTTSHEPLIDFSGISGPITPQLTNPLSMHPVEARNQVAVHGPENPRRRDHIPGHMTLRSFKSCLDLRRSLPQDSSSHKGVIAASKITVQSKTPSDSFTQYGTASHSAKSSSGPSTTSHKLPPSELAASLKYTTSSGPPFGSNYQKATVSSPPPRMTSFHASATPHTLGALSTLPSQVRARANSSGHQEGQDEGQGVSRSVYNPKPKTRMGVYSGMFRMKDKDRNGDK